MVIIEAGLAYTGPVPLAVLPPRRATPPVRRCLRFSEMLRREEDRAMSRHILLGWSGKDPHVVQRAVKVHGRHSERNLGGGRCKMNESWKNVASSRRKDGVIVLEANRWGERIGGGRSQSHNRVGLMKLFKAVWSEGGSEQAGQRGQRAPELGLYPSA